jgi:hypothetical protein
MTISELFFFNAGLLLSLVVGETFILHDYFYGIIYSLCGIMNCHFYLEYLTTEENA